MTWPHPLTHPSTHPPTHPPMGGGVSTNHKSSNRTELSWFSQHYKIFLVFWPDPTHQPTQPPTHPPNHTPTHGWGILHRFQIFKRNWNILISSSVIEFLLILGVHPLGGWQMGAWGGGGYGCVGVSHAHTHAHTRTRMHTGTHMHVKHANMLNMDASMSAAICNFYTCIHVCMCVCVRVCACACVGGHPHAPRCPWHLPTHLPPPQSRREPKTAKFNVLN